MLRSSRFIAFAEPSGSQPAALIDTATTSPKLTVTQSGQQPAPDSAASPPAHNEVVLKAASTGELSDTATHVMQAHGQLLDNQMSASRTPSSSVGSIAAYEQAQRADEDEGSASHDSGGATSHAGSSAASEVEGVTQLPPMVRCASPPSVSERPCSEARQRQDLHSPSEAPIILSDTVHMGSSLSDSGSSPHSLSTASSPRTNHQAASQPLSQSGLDAACWLQDLAAMSSLCASPPASHVAMVVRQLSEAASLRDASCASLGSARSSPDGTTPQRCVSDCPESGDNCTSLTCGSDDQLLACQENSSANLLRQVIQHTAASFCTDVTHVQVL